MKPIAFKKIKIKLMSKYHKIYQNTFAHINHFDESLFVMDFENYHVVIAVVFVVAVHHYMCEMGIHNSLFLFLEFWYKK
jgi:hypothetical protein